MYVMRQVEAGKIHRVLREEELRAGLASPSHSHPGDIERSSRLR
jgi:hypothetical protein